MGQTGRWGSRSDGKSPRQVDSGRSERSTLTHLPHNHVETQQSDALTIKIAFTSAQMFYDIGVEYNLVWSSSLCFSTEFFFLNKVSVERLESQMNGGTVR